MYQMSRGSSSKWTKMVAKGEIFLNDPSPKSNLAFFYHPRIIERLEL
jgi:hypothetical protein